MQSGYHYCDSFRWLTHLVCYLTQFTMPLAPNRQSMTKLRRAAFFEEKAPTKAAHDQCTVDGLDWAFPDSATRCAVHAKLDKRKGVRVGQLNQNSCGMDLERHG